MALSEFSSMEISYGIDKYNYGDRSIYQKNRFNPLHVMLSSGHAICSDVCILLAENSCFVAEKTPWQDDSILFDECALHIALKSHCDHSIIRLLIESFPMSLMMLDSAGMTPYHSAFFHCCDSIVISIIMRNTVHLSLDERYFLYTQQTHMKELLIEVAIRNRYCNNIVGILMRQTMQCIPLSGVNVITHERNNVEGLPPHLILKKHELLPNTWYITPFSLLEMKPNFVRHGDKTQCTVRKIHIGLNKIKLKLKTKEEILVNIIRSKEGEKYFHEMLALIKSNWCQRIIYTSLLECIRYQKGPIKTFGLIVTQLEQYDLKINLATNDSEENEQRDAVKIIQKILDNNEKTNEIEINYIKNIKRILHLFRDSILEYKNIKLEQISFKKNQDEEALHEQRLEKIAHDKSEAASKDLLDEEKNKELEKSSKINKKKSRRINKKTTNVMLKSLLISGSDSVVAQDINANVPFRNANPPDDTIDKKMETNLPTVIACHDVIGDNADDTIDKKSEKNLPTAIACHDVIEDNTDDGDDDNINECLLCMGTRKNTCFVPCGHLCVCSACAGIIMIKYFLRSHLCHIN